MYMAGFVVECLLKALLLERHPNLGVPVNPANLSRTDRSVLEMLFSHDLDKMIDALPEIRKKLTGLGEPSGRQIWKQFVEFCEEWTVYARYSPRTAEADRAREFLRTVNEIRKWLKEL
jgi:hypothetical protein